MSKETTRQPSRWLIGTIGKPNPADLGEVVTVRANTAQAAAETYMNTVAPDPDPEATVRVWPLRANGDAIDFKTTTVQIATAV